MHCEPDLNAPPLCRWAPLQYGKTVVDNGAGDGDCACKWEVAAGAWKLGTSSALLGCTQSRRSAKVVYYSLPRVSFYNSSQFSVAVPRFSLVLPRITTMSWQIQGRAKNGTFGLKLSPDQDDERSDAHANGSAYCRLKYDIFV